MSRVGLGRGAHGKQFPTFNAQFKFAKIQNSHVEGGRGACENQFLTFDAEFKFAKIQHSHVEGGGGGLWKPISNF